MATHHHGRKIAAPEHCSGGDTWGLGEVVELTVTFDEPVVVTGTPSLHLTFSRSQNPTAHYDAARSRGSKVVFTYEVRANDRSTSGVSVSNNIAYNTIDLEGGGIADRVGNPANLRVPVVSASTSRKVDGSQSFSAASPSTTRSLPPAAPRPGRNPDGDDDGGASGASAGVLALDQHRVVVPSRDEATFVITIGRAAASL